MMFQCILKNLVKEVQNQLKFNKANLFKIILCFKKCTNNYKSKKIKIIEFLKKLQI